MDDRLIFSHNGNPFKVQDLLSIVNQYSTKPEKSQSDEETTGKYGTGFMTTYIVSKKVSIQGLFCLKES